MQRLMGPLFTVEALLENTNLETSGSGINLTKKEMDVGLVEHDTRKY